MQEIAVKTFRGRTIVRVLPESRPDGTFSGGYFKINDWVRPAQTFASIPDAMRAIMAQ